MVRQASVVLACAGAVAAAAVLVLLEAQTSADSPAFTGLTPEAVVTPERLREVGVRVSAGTDVQLLVDGAPAKTRRLDDHILLADTDLSDGTHTLTARLRRWPLPDRELSRTLTVDGTPPRLVVAVEPAENLRRPMTLRGDAAEASTLTVAGRTVRVGDDGTFSVTLPTVPAVVRVVARDAAGNATVHEEPVPTRHPGMRAVHMSAIAWTSAALREPVLRMAEAGLMAAFTEQVDGTNATVIPWLQAFSLRTHYGPAEVRAQIRAAAKTGDTSFLLWNAACRYDPAGLSR